METAIVGGEALTAAHVKTLREHCPGIRIFNEYGPTETTVGAVAGYVDADDLHIGKPYANTRVYVLDAGLQPCPVGVSGELYIAGVGLARGYWNRPGLTAERFVANPFAIEPGERLYRTGDLASLARGRQPALPRPRRPAGEDPRLPHRARRDRGCPHARARDRAGGGDRARGSRWWRTLSARRQIDLRDLRRRLAARLPEYMVPAAFVILDALPLTRNGKLDRKALPAPEGTGLAAGYVAPARLRRSCCASWWPSCCAWSAWELADNFFHLGGHSLMATRLAARIRARLGRELPIRTIFDKPVLGDLARASAALSRVGDRAPLVADPAAAHAPFPLTPVQEAYWLGRQSLVELGEVACHVYVEIRFRTLDVERLTGAWRAVIDRHPMLRAVIAPDGTQRILAGSTLHDRVRRWQRGRRRVREEMSHQVLPCDRWPLFEVRVTRVADEDWRLHLSIDALILDGESNNLLLEESSICTMAGAFPCASPG